MTKIRFDNNTGLTLKGMLVNRRTSEVMRIVGLGGGGVVECLHVGRFGDSLELGDVYVMPKITLDSVPVGVDESGMVFEKSDREYTVAEVLR